MRKRIIIPVAISLILVGGAIGALPALGRWYIQSRAVPLVEARLGRTVEMGRIDLGWGKVVLERVAVRSTQDAEATPMVALPKITVTYRPWALLKGQLLIDNVVLESPVVALLRREDGKTNFLDLFHRKKITVRQGKVRIKQVVIRAGRWSLKDQRQGLMILADTMEGRVVLGGRSTLRLRPVQITSPLVSSMISFEQIEIAGRLSRSLAAALPEVTLHGGQVQLLPQLRLTGIQGTLRPEDAKGKITIDLEGSYGGAAAKLWSAHGWLAPFDRRGEVKVEAARFSLGRVASILGKTPVILPERTMVGGALKITYGGGLLSLDGNLEVKQLSLFHPMLARTPVLDLNGRVALECTLDLKQKTLRLKLLNLHFRGVEARLSGTIQHLTGKPLVELEFQVPPTPCQKILDSFPPSLMPQLQGFKLRGTFAAEIKTKIDAQDLKNLTLKGKVGIRRCKVVQVPELMSAERLQGPFEHQVETLPGSMMVFLIGPDHPDFTPYHEISPNVVNVFLTTEDAGFFRHHGFIPSQFRAALARNLKHGGFRLGASTISMQMVKNVLLSHEKTLSRKLQELFLTWYLEQVLAKERILEIYLNAIEFGPGIYGIKMAARHYFGKLPAEITPLEAAFFASILPSPKRRYVQYCRGELSPKWDRYVRRILRRMAAKGHVDEQEMATAKEQQIIFARDLEALSEADCNEQIKELLQAWKVEGRRRLRESVMRSAPHQIEMYMPQE